jgi:type I restriction-modification system DNA methylase subunit
MTQQAGNATRDIVAKLWGLCHVLRDDGITYNEYVTELTYLLFLKMMQETGHESRIPNGYCWGALAAREGLDQLEYYRRLLLDLGDTKKTHDPTILAIFADAATSLRKPANLKTGGRAAVVVPDNVLFFTRGKTDKANTQAVWVYDLRANMPAFGKTRPLTAAAIIGHLRAALEEIEGLAEELEGVVKGRRRRDGVTGWLGKDNGCGHRRGATRQDARQGQEPRDADGLPAERECPLGRVRLDRRPGNALHRRRIGFLRHSRCGVPALPQTGV